MAESVKTQEKPRNKGGRPKGSPNKQTVEFRETIQRLLDSNRENVAKWIAEIAEGQPEVKDKQGNVIRAAVAGDKDKALRHITNLAEFAAPKLNRTEVTGQDGGPLTVTINKIA